MSREIRFECQECKSVLKIDDSFAGKQGKCPKCGKVIQIPAYKMAFASERQKDYAKTLGIEFSDNITKSEISKLIDDAVDAQNEVRFAKLNDRESEVRQEIRQEILDELEDYESAAYQRIRENILDEIDEEDCRLSKAKPELMIDELSAREVSAVLLTFDSNAIDFENLKFEGVSGSIYHTDDLSDKEAKIFLVCLADQIMQDFKRKTED